MSEIIASIKIDFDWIEVDKILNLTWIRIKIFTVGCGEKCVSLTEFESLTQLKAEMMKFCGSDAADLGIGVGRTKLLLIHSPCEITTKNSTFRVPETSRGLPNFVKVRNLSYTLQELGGGARIRVLHGLEPRVYLLITPSQATLELRDGRSLTIPPEPILLATPGGSELKLSGISLKLP